MDPDVMASSELTALLQAQDGDELQHQHLAAAVAEEGVPEHTRADYEASRRAVFQVSGLCCRPGCTRPAWRNPGGGRGSAFCTSWHANSYGLGFKPGSDPRTVGGVAAKLLKAVLAEGGDPDESLYSMLRGQLNCSRDLADLADIHLALVDIAASGAIPDRHIASIGSIYHERLAELLGTTPPGSPPVVTSTVMATSASGDVTDNPRSCRGREPARLARKFTIGNDYRNPVVLLAELGEQGTATLAAQHGPDATTSVTGGGSSGSVDYASAKAVAAILVDAGDPASPAPGSNYATARAVLPVTAATDLAYEASANGDGTAIGPSEQARRTMVFPAGAAGVVPSSTESSTASGVGAQCSTGYEEPVVRGGTPMYATPQAVAAAASAAVPEAVCSTGYEEPVVRGGTPMYATPLSVEDAAGDAGPLATMLLLGGSGSAGTDVDRAVLQRAAYGSRKRRGYTGDPLVAMISGSGVDAGGAGPTGTHGSTEPGPHSATDGSVIMRTASTSTPLLPPVDYPGVGLCESITDEDLYSSIALARQGRSRAKVLPFESVQLADKVLGKGKFGVVRDGIYTPRADDNGARTGQPQRVAVKMLHPDLDPAELSEQQDDMVREAKIMAHFAHPNIVGLVGIVVPVSNQVPCYLVVSFCAKGSLDKLLRNTGQPLEPPTLWRYTGGIAEGMRYLASKQFVHRDLAARNVLVDEANVPQIADFGLSRGIRRTLEVGSRGDDSGAGRNGHQSAYYEMTDPSKKLPIRWLSPEALSLDKKRFSEKSDVWSYAVTLIEVYTRGASPYSTCRTKMGKPWDNAAVAVQVKDEGFVHPKPPDCPAPLYDRVIYPCLCFEREGRPRFGGIVTELCAIADEWGWEWGGADHSVSSLAPPLSMPGQEQ